MCYLACYNAIFHSTVGCTVSTSDMNSWHLLGNNTESDDIYSKLKLETD